MDCLLVHIIISQDSIYTAVDKATMALSKLISRVEAVLQVCHSQLLDALPIAT